MNRTPDIDRVTAILHEVAQRLVNPRFRHLSKAEVESKPTPTDPDDVVTIVDREVEAELSKALRGLRPPAAVLGEEAAHARPELLQLLESAEPLWVIDPIDGTRNFAAGDDGFGITVFSPDGGGRPS